MISSEMTSQNHNNDTEICYICHDEDDLIINPCGNCNIKVHHYCLITNLVANWSMQADGYSYRNCSMCRRRYPSNIIRHVLDMIHELNLNMEGSVIIDGSENQTNDIQNVAIQNAVNRNHDIYPKCFKNIILFIRIILSGIMFYLLVSITSNALSQVDEHHTYNQISILILGVYFISETMHNLFIRCCNT